jgi:adenylate cyclase
VADPAVREEEWRRRSRRLALAFSGANVAGAVLVFVFLSFVVPRPSDVKGNATVLWINTAVFFVVIVVATVVANRLGPRAAEPVRRWFVAGRDPDAAERAATLRQPWAQMGVSATVWGSAAVLVTAVNALVSPVLGALVGFTTFLGGLCACALTYLLAERLGRDVTAAALAGGVPDHPAGPGVAARILLAWALAAGIPLLGAMSMGLVALTGADVSLERVGGTVLFLGAFGLVFGFVAVRMAARSIADPVESVRAAVRDVQAGDLDAEVTVFDGSEVGLLQAGFNRMVEGLRERERLHDLFGRHVGREVARRALDRGVELGGEMRECAALFVDLVGSTALAATRPATEVVDVLNRFFSVVVEVTHRHGGWVNKFEGDAALCVFGAPEDPGGAPERALAAARELSVRLRSEVPEVRAAVGVSWGPCVAGNVGAAERYEYTVIGDPINEAARLSDLAKERESGVLASEAIVAAASAGERERWSLGEAVVLRGRTEPTRLAEPVGDAPPR